MTGYDWYAIVEAEEGLRQGDLIDACPIVVPPPTIKVGEEVDIEVVQYNVVVMSQSCDLEERKIDLVLTCPIWTMTEFVTTNKHFVSSKAKEGLWQGNAPGYHLLNRCDVKGFETEYLVADFRAVYSVSISVLEDYVKNAGKRRRLLPPYREHLSQAFARFFMRVGLPVDIPKFWKAC
jgi:hypothetical protein